MEVDIGKYKIIKGKGPLSIGSDGEGTIVRHERVSGLILAMAEEITDLKARIKSAKDTLTSSIITQDVGSLKTICGVVFDELNGC